MGEEEAAGGGGVNVRQQNVGTNDVERRIGPFSRFVHVQFSAKRLSHVAAHLADPPPPLTPIPKIITFVKLLLLLQRSGSGTHTHTYKHKIIVSGKFFIFYVVVLLLSLVCHCTVKYSKSVFEVKLGGGGAKI